MAANKVEADIILVDVGPHLGAINRSVLIATDYVIIPLGDFNELAKKIGSIIGIRFIKPTMHLH